MLTCKVYRDNGKYLSTIYGIDEADCMRKIDKDPATVLASKTGGIKIRLEDENGSGCWIVVGPPSQGKLR